MALSSKVTKALAKLSKQDKNGLFSSEIAALETALDGVADDKEALKQVKAESKAVKAGNKYYNSAFKASSDKAYAEAKANEAKAATEAGDKAEIKNIKANIKAVKAAEKAAAKAGLDAADAKEFVDSIKANADAANAKDIKAITKQVAKKQLDAGEAADKVENIGSDDNGGNGGGGNVTPGKPGETFTLTTGTDTFIGTAGNDTVTGTSATLQVGDAIIDQTSTDNDTLNLTLTATNAAARISGIENINVNWDAFGDAGFDATNVTDATVTLSSAKVGYLGNATVTAAGANTIVAGEGIKNNLTVNGVTGATVNAGAAKTVTVNGTAATTDTATVTAGATTTDVTVSNVETVTATAGAATTDVTITGYDSATVDAGVATAITLTDDAATDTATVKVGADATVTNTGSFGKLALDIADGKTVTLDNIGTDVTVAGAGNVTLKTSAVNGEKVLNTKTSGTLTVETDETGALDLTNVAADLVKLTGNVAAAVTVKTGSNVQAAADLGAASFVVGGTATTDTITVTLSKSQAASTTFTGIETVNLVAAADQATAPTVTDLTLASLVAAGNTVNLSGSNDVKVASLNAKVLDSTNLNGELIVSDTSTATDVTIAGAQGKNDVTFNAAAVKAAFIGQSAADKVNFGTLAAAAAATAVTGAGNDEVTVNVSTLTTGSLAVEAGAGDDVVNLNGAVVGTTGTIVLQFGEGTDTLKLGASSDLSAANLTMTGLEKLVINTDAIFSGAQLTGKTLVVEGTTANAADTITVKGNVAAGETIDLSGLTGTDSVTTGIKGAVITGNAGADVIIGTNRDDVITGGAGNDTLTGGAGNDTFVLSGPTAALNGKDTITDFTGAGVAGGDVIQLSKAAFSLASNIGSGFSTATEFASVADDAAVEASTALVVFSQATGTVFYNATSGADDAVALVTLTGVNNLAAGDFDIVA